MVLSLPSARRIRGHRLDDIHLRLARRQEHRVQRSARPRPRSGARLSGCGTGIGCARALRSATPSRAHAPPRSSCRPCRHPTCRLSDASSLLRSLRPWGPFWSRELRRHRLRGLDVPTEGHGAAHRRGLAESSRGSYLGQRVPAASASRPCRGFSSPLHLHLSPDSAAHLLLATVKMMTL